MTRFDSRRPGFTLLEIVVAMAIAILLLGGLYVAMTTQILHAKAGRDRITEANLARGVLQRMASDISVHLAPPVPATQPADAAATTTTTDAAASSTTTTTPTTPSTTPTTSGTETADASATTTTGSGAVNFNQGVYGEANRLELHVGRASGELFQAPAGENGGPIVSDLRRIVYWMDSGGLARQEVKLVTSDDEINAVPADGADSARFVIAPHVTSVSFEYFDGTDWQTSWYGSDLGEDGKTPKGPPAAIRITLTMRSPSARLNDPEAPTLTYQHVVAVPTANNPLAQTTTDGIAP
jgi:prepilin-type N-terminal cleavage/methylation domain-containing protein